VELTYASVDHNRTPNITKNIPNINNNIKINKNSTNLKKKGSNSTNFSLNSKISRFLSTNALIQDRLNSR
jgi:hypothetical protein